MKFEYYRSSDGWRWRLRAANGEIIATGEAYHNKNDLVTTLTAMQLGVSVAPIAEVEHNQIGNTVEHDLTEEEPFDDG